MRPARGIVWPMRKVWVPLPDDAWDRLLILAEQELRDPRQQATVLILDGLEQAGIHDRTSVRGPTAEGDPAAGAV